MQKTIEQYRGFLLNLSAMSHYRRSINDGDINNIDYNNGATNALFEIKQGILMFLKEDEDA